MPVPLADKGKVHLVVSALSYSTVFYLLAKFEDKQVAKEKLRKLKVIVKTSDLTDKVIDKGLSSKFSDFEDALQYHCAINMDCKIFITRNEKNFRDAVIPVMTPDEFLTSLNEK